MINLCRRCKKVIANGDKVTMLIEGIYSAINSISSFRLHNDIKFKTGTLAHADCEEEDCG